MRSQEDSSFGLEKGKRLWVVFFLEMKLIDSLTCPQEKRIYDKEFGVKSVVRIQNPEQMKKKKEPFVTSREKPLQERKYSLPGLAVSSTDIE